MRVVFGVFYGYDEVLSAGGAAGFLEFIPFHRELSSALARAGHEVDVVVHSPIDEVVEDRGVRFRFVEPRLGDRAAGAIPKWLGRRAGYYVPALRAVDAIVRTKADVVHFHGATLHLNLALLAARLDRE